MTKDTLKEAIVQKLRINCGCTPRQAGDGDMLRACAMVLRDIMAERNITTREDTDARQLRQVHYLSLEFLMGRSLMKNAYNLGLTQPLTQAVEELGFKAADLFEHEPDAGLGNGGLGRLAACYLDSMTTLNIPATGYSICYELGIFKQAAEVRFRERHFNMDFNLGVHRYIYGDYGAFIFCYSARISFNYSLFCLCGALSHREWLRLFRNLLH